MAQRKRKGEVVRFLEDAEAAYQDKVGDYLTREIQAEMDRLYLRHTKLRKATVTMGTFYVEVSRKGYAHTHLDDSDAPKYMGHLIWLLQRANVRHVSVDVWPTRLPCSLRPR